VNHQCIYWDVKLECFGLRVYPSGRRAYVCAYRLQGRKRLTVLSRVERLTLDEARTTACYAQRRRPRATDTTSVARDFTSLSGPHRRQSYRNSSAYRTSPSRSSVDAPRFPDPGGVIGRASRPVNAWRESLTAASGTPAGAAENPREETRRYAGGVGN